MSLQNLQRWKITEWLWNFFETRSQNGPISVKWKHQSQLIFWILRLSHKHITFDILKKHPVFLSFGFSWLMNSMILWYCVDVETETHWDWDTLRLSNFLVVKTETHRVWNISWMSRLRLIESKKFLGCQDPDSSRLRNFLDVEAETHWILLGYRD